MEAVEAVLKLFPVRGKEVLKDLTKKWQLTREPFKSATFQVFTSPISGLKHELKRGNFSRNGIHCQTVK